MAKTIEELFTPDLNGTAVSALHAGLADQLRQLANNEDNKKRRKPKTVTPFPK